VGEMWFLERRRAHRQRRQSAEVLPIVCWPLACATTTHSNYSLLFNANTTPTMKRGRSDSDTQGCNTNHAKRHNAHGADVCAPRASLPLSNPSLQTFALTKEALDLFESLSTGRMTAPPTPRSTSSQSRGRPRRPARTRAPSPSKKPTPQTYRTRNLHHANVFVDTLPNLPPLIDDAVRHVLGINSWDEQPTAPEKHLDTIATWYQAESQRNTRDVSIEGDWKFSLFGLLRQLSDPLAGDLKAHSSDKGSLVVAVPSLCSNMLTLR
jgi:hypothetical protein